MQIGGQPRTVELTVDLTRYHPSLIAGTRGRTVPDMKSSIWGSQDRFVAVQFPETTLDVLWKSLVIEGEQ